jgi:hypothetical protein
LTRLDIQVMKNAYQNMWSSFGMCARPLVSEKTSRVNADIEAACKSSCPNSMLAVLEGMN